MKLTERIYSNKGEIITLAAILIAVGFTAVQTGDLNIDHVNGQWIVQLEDKQNKATDKIWNGEEWVNESNYTVLNKTKWEEYRNQKEKLNWDDNWDHKEKTIRVPPRRRMSQEDTIYDIDNWSKVVTVKDYKIQDKKLYTTFTIQDYRDLGGTECTLKLKYINFHIDNEDYDKLDKKHVPSRKLCVGDQIIVRHETNNVFPHPKGRLTSKWKFSTGTKKIDNTTKVTEYKEGLFHVEVE